MNISKDTEMGLGEKYEGRKPRTCGSFTKPLTVLILLFLSAYSFFVLEMSHHLKFWFDWHDTSGSETFEAASSATITNWVFYWLVWVLAVWSLGCMVWSSPGYVPNHYKYDLKKMNEND